MIVNQKDKPMDLIATVSTYSSNSGITQISQETGGGEPVEKKIRRLTNQAIPKLKFPFTSKYNGYAEVTQHRTIKWLKKFNIFSIEEHLSKVCTSNFGHFIGKCHPKAELKILSIIADWATMLFIYDDMIEKCKNSEVVKGIHQRKLSILRGSQVEVSDSHLMHGIADLSCRIDEIASQCWKKRFTRDVANYCDATTWESENRSAKKVPLLDIYLKMRPNTSGTYMMFDFIEISGDFLIPEDIFESEYFKSLRLIGANLVNWENDLHSSQKEAREGDVHNLIFVLKAQYDISYEEAFDRAVEMYNSEVVKFENLKKNMPHFGEFNEVVKKYIEGVSDWVSAHHYWAGTSSRYQLNQDEIYQKV